MQVALGRDETTSHRKNSYLLGPHIKGSSGLFFSPDDADLVLDYFKNYSCPYFGTVGTVPGETLILERGSDKLNAFPTSMESQFRLLGVHLKLDNSKFIILNDYVLCEAGKPIKPEQAKMIKHLGIKLDEFKITVVAYLTKNGEFKDISTNMDIN